MTGLVERYLALGLAMNAHVDGFVDSYYGPDGLAQRALREGKRSPEALVSEARSLLAAIDAGEPLGEPTGGAAAPQGAEETATRADQSRRRYLRAQVLGVLTSARVLSGEAIAYSDEVEACYGLRPRRVPEDDLAAAHRDLEAVVPGTGPLAERYVAWREAQAVPHEVLVSAINSLAEDLRARSATLFGLPEGEHVEFELVTDKPWSGFNYYLGGLRSRVAVSVDLPVLSTSLAHLVAHEAYPGHHTEHARKEVGLVRRRRYFEESIALVGTPACLIAEGLADLGLEIVMGRRPEHIVAEHLRPLKIPYDPDVVTVVNEASEALGGVRANAAFRLHEDRADPDTVAGEIARFGLVSTERARKLVEFLLDPTWRAYLTCYVEGLPLCRRFAAGDPLRFARLITEQLTVQDLVEAAA